MRKLFVGGISWDTTDEGLEAAFSPFGNVVSAKIIKDRDTGRSRGFGFVEFDDAESASSAMQNLDGTELDGRNIKVAEAQERSSRGGGGNRGDNRGGGRGGRKSQGRGRDSY